MEQDSDNPIKCFPNRMIDENISNLLSEQVINTSNSKECVAVSTDNCPSKDPILRYCGISVIPESKSPILD